MSAKLKAGNLEVAIMHSGVHLARRSTSSFSTSDAKRKNSVSSLVYSIGEGIVARKSCVGDMVSSMAISAATDASVLYVWSGAFVVLGYVWDASGIVACICTGVQYLACPQRRGSSLGRKWNILA